jgi:hypothetical protein
MSNESTIVSIAQCLAYALDCAKHGQFFYAGEWRQRAAGDALGLSDHAVRARADELGNAVSKVIMRLESDAYARAVIGGRRG